LKIAEGQKEKAVDITSSGLDADLHAQHGEESFSHSDTYPGPGATMTTSTARNRGLTRRASSQASSGTNEAESEAEVEPGEFEESNEEEAVEEYFEGGHFPHGRLVNWPRDCCLRGRGTGIEE
jgi:hypothetical protein